MSVYYNKKGDSTMTKEEIRKMRLDLNFTQKKCADLLQVGLRTWQQWEYGERKMPNIAIELFKILTKTKRGDE